VLLLPLIYRRVYAVTSFSSRFYAASTILTPAKYIEGAE
jgi:hypothetical protein